MSPRDVGADPVADGPTPDAERDARIERIAQLALAASTGGVLGIARWLTPAAAGHSTHTQLGLTGCTFLGWTGLPCPMCGATTTFALLAEGRVLEGLANQPFASLLFLLTLATFAISLAEAIAPRGRWTWLGERVAPHEAKLAIAFLVLMFVGWTYKIGIMW